MNEIEIKLKAVEEIIGLHEKKTEKININVVMINMSTLIEYRDNLIKQKGEE